MAINKHTHLLGVAGDPASIDCMHIPSPAQHQQLWPSSLLPMLLFAVASAAAHAWSERHLSPAPGAGLPAETVHVGPGHWAASQGRCAFRCVVGEGTGALVAQSTPPQSGWVTCVQYIVAVNTPEMQFARGDAIQCLLTEPCDQLLYCCVSCVLRCMGAFPSLHA